ncbi:hypothetical protein ANRL4_01873 [Anaerolineae bacterium]|nr:hypothetical protein ANRL4_01873 [Anaerolineae bacterium]
MNYGDKRYPPTPDQSRHKQNDPTARTVGSTVSPCSSGEVESEQRQKKTAISAYTETAARAKMRTSPPDWLHSSVG